MYNWEHKNCPLYGVEGCLLLRGWFLSIEVNGRTVRTFRVIHYIMDVHCRRASIKQGFTVTWMQFLCFFIHFFCTKREFLIMWPATICWIQLHSFFLSSYLGLCQQDGSKTTNQLPNIRLSNSFWNLASFPENILDYYWQTHRVWPPSWKLSVVYLAVIMMLSNFQSSLPNPPWLGITVSPMTLKRLTLINSETFSVRSPGTAAS